MNKEIEKIQSKLADVKSERVRAEVRYSTHIIIMNGHREVLREMERISQGLMANLLDSEHEVGEYISKLQKAVEAEGLKKAESELKP